MSKEKILDMKKLGTEVTEESLVSLKILALKKRVSLAEYVREVLEKHINSKLKQVDTIESE